MLQTLRLEIEEQPLDPFCWGTLVFFTYCKEMKSTSCSGCLVAIVSLSAPVWTGQLDGLPWLNIGDNQARHCLPGRGQGKVAYSSNDAPHGLGHRGTPQCG